MVTKHASSLLMPPSRWVQRFTHTLNSGARVIDWGCGCGRHARWLAARGCLVLALDRDPVVLTEMAGLTGVETRCVDLETDDWPVPETGGQYDALIVTHYLFRPHLAALPSVLKPGGLLIYETFAQGHEMLGRPRRPDFLLAPGELLQVFSQTMHVIAYEDGWIESPSSARVQRIAAMLPIQSNPVLDRFSGYFYPIDYTP